MPYTSIVFFLAPKDGNELLESKCVTIPKEGESVTVTLGSKVKAQPIVVLFKNKQKLLDLLKKKKMSQLIVKQICFETIVIITIYRVLFIPTYTIPVYFSHQSCSMWASLS